MGWTVAGIACLIFGCLIGHLFESWRHFRRCHVMTGGRVRDQIRWTRSLNRIERGLRKEARDYYLAQWDHR